MTKLLISVRDAEEARSVLHCPIDILDVKEPNRGSLGAVSADVAAAIADIASGCMPLSVALGELMQNDSTPGLPSSLLSRFAFAKIGLAGAAQLDWEIDWERWRCSLPKNVEPVAVIYADHELAAAPAPACIVDLAVRYGVGILVDTFTKNRGVLFDFLPVTELDSILRAAHRKGVWIALAGSLSPETISTAAVMGADIVAVRGAVCRAGGRTNPLCPTRIRSLSDRLRLAAAKKMTTAGLSHPQSSTPHKENY